MGRVRKGRSSRDKGPPKGRGGASVTVAEQMSGEGSEQRSGPAEAILARRSSRPEMPGWLLKEGADEEDERVDLQQQQKTGVCFNLDRHSRMGGRVSFKNDRQPAGSAGHT